MHFLEDAAGMVELLRDRLVVEGRGEAEHVRVEDGPRAHAAAQDVPVDAHDAGHGAAVRVQRAGGIVGLGLHAHVPVFRERDDAGVVGEDGLEPRGLGPHLLGSGLDEGLVQGGDVPARRRSHRYTRCPAAKILCLQCSLQVWASTSSSTSVGSEGRPALERWARVSASA